MDVRLVVRQCKISSSLILKALLQVERGFLCEPTCRAQCGDGLISAAEQCDDNNQRSGATAGSAL